MILRLNIVPMPMPMRFKVFLAAVSLAVAAANAAEPPAKVYQSPGTRKMAERLEKITREIDPMNNPFLNQARAEKLIAQLRPLLSAPLTAQTVSQRYLLQVNYA